MNEIEIVNSLLNKMNNGIITQDEYKVLQYYLIKNSKEFETNYPICTTNLNDNSVLFISDTHIGSIYENDNFIEYAYNFATKSNINTIIHLGDLIEGTSREFNRTYDSVKEELIRAINFVSWYGLSTKILLGNHDFSIINKFAYPLRPNLIHDFCGTNMLFEILGLGKVVLNWNGVKIGLNHYISEKQIHFGDYNSDVDFFIKGHTHFYSLDEENRNICLPSLSNELKDRVYYDSRDLKKYGYTLEKTKPYINFVKASFVDNNEILLEEYREKDGLIIIFNSALFNKNTLEFKKIYKKY